TPGIVREMRGIIRHGRATCEARADPRRSGQRRGAADKATRARSTAEILFLDRVQAHPVIGRGLGTVEIGSFAVGEPKAATVETRRGAKPACGSPGGKGQVGIGCATAKDMVERIIVPPPVNLG